MNLRTSWFLILGTILFLGTAGYRYYEYVVVKNYEVNATAPCEAGDGTCFVASCDSSDPDCDKTPYEKISALAKNLPSCVLDEDCEGFVCGNIPDCEITPCEPESLEDGEGCFVQAHPIPNDIEASSTPEADENP